MVERILLIEDEVGLRMTVEDRLRAEGYQLQTAADGLYGYELALEGESDLIVLDLMLPKKHGLDICRDLRERGIPTPVLMLTARGQLTDRVRGLKLGADDYLVKPFEMVELLARIDAILRRERLHSRGARQTYEFGDAIVDLRQSAVFKGGRRLRISAKEFDLLLYFIRHRRQTLSRDNLLCNVWHYKTGLSTRTVDVHVGSLRQKIEEDPTEPRWIVTRHGIGYIFDPA